MSGTSYPCPVEPDVRDWVHRRMGWLIETFGRDRLRSATVVLPRPEFFPDPYDGSPETVRVLFDRVCGYMGVAPETVEISLYEERAVMPMAEGWVHGTAGLYHEEGGKVRIWLEQRNRDDPLALVATMAHELGHVLLLGHGKILADEDDHEPLTDLLTVFLGLGIISANSVVREKNWSDGLMSGWSVGRQGYLTMPIYGYALAVFAHERWEGVPKWGSQLRPDVRHAFRQGLAYLAATDPRAATSTEPRDKSAAVPKRDAARDEAAPGGVGIGCAYCGNGIGTGPTGRRVCELSTVDRD